VTDKRILRLSAKNNLIFLFHPAAVTDSTAWASIINRHEKNREKRKAAARFAAQQTCFWGGPFMVGHICASAGDFRYRVRAIQSPPAQQ
jgi:hypothetical protein